VTVTYAAPTSGASAILFTPTPVTDNTGSASTTGLANLTAGSYSITATVAGLGSVATFSITNQPDVPSSVTVLSGTGQNATVNTAFANDLVVIVTDQFGNPVPNVTVTFVAPNSGAQRRL